MTETVPFSTLSDEWKADPAFAAEYERIGPEMELAFAPSGAARWWRWSLRSNPQGTSEERKTVYATSRIRS